MNTLYAITQNNQPISRGNSGKTSWKSIRWVLYHLGIRKSGVGIISTSQTEWKKIWLNGLEVQTINFKTGTVIKQSAISFIAHHSSPEEIKEDINKKLGWNIDLAGLESLVRSEALNERQMTLAIEYLKTKGISC